MSQESRAIPSQNNSRPASEAGVVVEITVTTARKLRGSVRFSRSGKVLEYREKEREERDSIIYLTTPRTPAYWAPACVYVRGERFSREVFSAGHRYFQAGASEDGRGNSHQHRQSLFGVSGFLTGPTRREAQV